MISLHHIGRYNNNNNKLLIFQEHKLNQFKNINNNILSKLDISILYITRFFINLLFSDQTLLNLNVIYYVLKLNVNLNLCEYA